MRESTLRVGLRATSSHPHVFIRTDHRELNIAFDRAAPVAVSAQVVAKQEHSRKGGMRYTIVPRDDTGHAGSHRIDIPRALFVRIEPGQTVSMDEHPGLLGYRWIDGVRL